MSEFHIGQRIGGRYQIESLLGRGGMSSVYKGFDPNLQRPVAIKLIHRHLSERPEWIKRFEQEASAVAKLRHPSIIQVYDFNKDDSTFYMVMEYVAGQTLDKKLEALNNAKLALPLPNILSTMITLCEAVGYAHNQQIIHRDLKPSNVILNLLDKPVLMDFGIAKMVGSDIVQTAVGTTLGTAAYMAPEQITGQPIDHRADLYALGVILYELLSGAPPFQGNSPMTVMMKHVKEPVPDLRLSQAWHPEMVIAIAEKALQKQPEARFQSAADMATALRTAAGGSSTYTVPSLNTTSTSLSRQQTAVDNQPSAPTPPNPPPATSTYQPTPTPAKRTIPIQPLAIGGGLLLLALLAYFLLPSLLQTPPTATGMVNIPAGSYTIGYSSGGNQFVASQTIELDEYWIDRYEISHAQYAAFVTDTNAAMPASWVAGAIPVGQENHPAQGVTWQMAADYCSWANKRLPSEAEWEVAARGQQAWLYPWGNDANLVTLTNSSSYPVGTMPANRSSFGVYDMASNVWEWVADPYAAVDNGQHILRGGAYDFQKDMVYRLAGDPTIPTMTATAGFRCAASQVEAGSNTQQLLLDDDFTSPDSGWPEFVETNVLQGYHPPDYYHVQASAPGQIATAYFGGDFANVGLETAVFVDSTTTDSGDFRYGLILRRIDEQFYAFTISPRSQKWYVLKATTAGLETITTGDITTLNGMNSNDILRIDAAGDQFTFFINNQLVAQLADADYTTGDIGFYVETFDESFAHIHYDSLQMNQLSEAATR